LHDLSFFFKLLLFNKKTVSPAINRSVKLKHIPQCGMCGRIKKKSFFVKLSRKDKTVERLPALSFEIF